MSQLFLMQCSKRKCASVKLKNMRIVWMLDNLQWMLQVHLQRLEQQCLLRGLAAQVREEQIDPDNVGIIGREHEYEGGFVLVTIKRVTASCDERTDAQMDACA